VISVVSQATFATFIDDIYVYIADSRGTKRTGRPEHDSKVRASRTGQPRQDSWDRTDRKDKVQSGHDSMDRTVGTGQLKRRMLRQVAGTGQASWRGQLGQGNRGWTALPRKVRQTG
jgi:hypothetical protein